MPVPMKKSWLIQPRVSLDGEGTLDGYSPVMQQMLFNRGILDTDAAAHYLRDEGSTHDPFLLPDMAAAVERIWYALDHQEPRLPTVVREAADRLRSPRTFRAPDFPIPFGTRLVVRQERGACGPQRSLR